MKRSFGVAGAIIATALALSTATSGTASARWTETPRIGVAGEEVWTVGNNNTCSGTFHAGLKNNPRKPGRVKLTLRSKGFTRDHCRVTVRFAYNNTIAPFHHEKYVRVEGTRKRGTIIGEKELWIGSGVDLVSITTTHPASKGVSYYIAIP